MKSQLFLLTTAIPYSVQIVGEVLKQLTEEKCKFICIYSTRGCNGRMILVIKDLVI